jgi:GntR family transcriptional regulator of vanillate catabolism
MAARFGRLMGASLADQARDLIRDAIFEGKIRPEERLTIERIAAELKISRTPVREALKALEMDGVVRLLPHRGAIVKGFSKRELHHRYSVRAMLEGYAAELACEADSKKLADELEANCEQLAELSALADVANLDEVRPLIELNIRFHNAIHEASDSTTLLRLLDSMKNPLAFMLYYWRSRERQLASIGVHREIAAAFRANKPKLVRRLAEKHLLEARDYLMTMDS